MNYSSITFLCVLLLTSGCGSETATPSPNPTNTPTPQAKSTLQTMVGGFTGQTAVEKGKETKAQLKIIETKRNADMNEVMP